MAQALKAFLKDIRSAVLKAASSHAIPVTFRAAGTSLSGQSVSDSILLIPENMDSLCCGMIWESKGQKDIADKKSAELAAALSAASDGGRYPILCDQSPCLHRMRKTIPDLKLYGPVGFIKEFLIPRLEFHPDDTPVLLHTTCSTRLMGLEKDLLEIARLCSTDVRTPDDILCCGFAGDKGMTRPELNQWSLRKLRSQAAGVPVGYTNSRTCEIGLETHSGIPYMSIIYLVNSHTTRHE